MADVREVKWMACANRGFYVHLSTLAEVRERVLEHVNVLARPLVLQRHEHPVVWTPVYANVTVSMVLWIKRNLVKIFERNELVTIGPIRKKSYIRVQSPCFIKRKFGHYSLYKY